QQSAQHVGDARPGHGRNDERRLPRSAFEPGTLLLQLFRRQRVSLVQRHDFGLFTEPLAIGLKFRADGLVDFSRVLGGAVDKMQEHAAALDMPEEAVAQPCALMSALDEAGDIGEHEFAAIDFDHAELGMRSEEHTSELQSLTNLVCRLLLDKKN